MRKSIIRTAAILLGIVVISVGFVSKALAFEASRPDPKGTSTKVTVNMYVLDIDDISSANQRFMANVYYALRWKDKRLIPKKEDEDVVIYPASQVWMPNMQILNQQRMWKTFPDVVTVDREGNVTYRQRVWGSFSQTLDLHNFPFDKQDFNIIMVIPGIHEEQVKLVIDKTRPSGISKRLSVPDWKILSWHLKLGEYRVSPEYPNITGLMFTIYAKRYVEFYILVYIVPLIIIVIMSLFSFWISPDEINTRVSIAIMSMLTLIAYRFLIANAIPKVSYLTRMDFFILGSTLIVFATLMFLTITSFLVKRGKMQKARRFDVWLRILMPIAYSIITVFSLMIY